MWRGDMHPWDFRQRSHGTLCQVVVLAVRELISFFTTCQSSGTAQCLHPSWLSVSVSRSYDYDERFT